MSSSRKRTAQALYGANSCCAYLFAGVLTGKFYFTRLEVGPDALRMPLPLLIEITARAPADFKE
jgi:hypothetical protein